MSIFIPDEVVYTTTRKSPVPAFFSIANVEPMKSLHILILLLLVVGVFGVYKWRDGTLHPTISQEGEDFKDAFVVVLGLTAAIGAFIIFCFVPVMRAF